LKVDIRPVSIAAQKMAEVLALPEQDRAWLARRLIASLDDTVDPDSETEWHSVIDRRSREIQEGKVVCRPVEQVVRDIRQTLRARRKPS
jgi:putative addiction module component (TIGR02574 family)